MLLQRPVLDPVASHAWPGDGERLIVVSVVHLALGISAAFARLSNKPSSFEGSVRQFPSTATLWVSRLVQSTVLEEYLRRVRRSEERRVGKECRSRWSPDDG